MPDALERLDGIAAEHLAVLHRTLQEEPTAFGLYEAACAAGERLTAAVHVWTVARDGDEFAAHFTATVGGEGGTVADAAVRRAAARSARRLLEEEHSAGAPGGSGMSGEVFCLLYRGFFADVVAEFLRTAVAEKVKLVVPLLPALDPEDHIADWIAEHVLHLLPNPCEEATRRTESVEKAEQVVSAVEDPSIGSLRLVAHGLVPRAAGRALGLLSDRPSGSTDGTPYEGEPAA
ncbi:hypothetical protein [Streptomyces rapamycinicus]|uniref:TetR family transcriptional regulator n=1 Tax=Streptomyces rapamycinicus TaxID=1226757 RepID=A0ABR6LJN4_9ACTN|nr:hypothetical protein [Streptomyces rapamycinicus]AGP55007.1 hypothetical protein M271_17225 [Streptomyces rapamycinicus NRRL 5491]MBB4782535.1 hypothetical protein [Streptomyces rapamycinicus]UTO63036.1 hypothetical protein LJB45_12370 [Streptomyces rapamycinicus]UTP30995.1 hypothetical protein LIV37_17485 [Streptomyces rapamycinicus NRRL 5491]